jgi:hypothetical protein
MIQNLHPTKRPGPPAAFSTPQGRTASFVPGSVKRPITPKNTLFYPTSDPNHWSMAIQTIQPILHFPNYIIGVLSKTTPI